MISAQIPLLLSLDLLRQDEQLTFLRLVPGRVQYSDESKNRDMPELLQWSPQANAPLEVRLFGD